MDESGNGDEKLPLIVGAMVSDAASSELETAARRLYEDLSSRDTWTGYDSFEEFRRTGFHASSDPPEVSVPFMELMHEVSGFKTYMVMTDRSTLRPRNEKEQIEDLYERLLGDLLLQYRRYPKIVCLVEENETLRSSLPQIAGRARIRAMDKLDVPTTLPQLDMQFVSKSGQISMAIIDYVMMAVSRWVRTGYTQNPKCREYRDFRRVEPTVSYLFSLEDGTISSRKIELH